MDLSLRTLNPNPSLHVYVYILLLLLTFEPSFSGLLDYVRMLILFSGGGRPWSLTCWPWCFRQAYQNCTPLMTSAMSGMLLCWEWLRKKLKNIFTQNSRKLGKMPGAQVSVGMYMDLQRTIGSRNQMCVSWLNFIFTYICNVQFFVYKPLTLQLAYLACSMKGWEQASNHLNLWRAVLRVGWGWVEDELRVGWRTCFLVVTISWCQYLDRMKIDLYFQKFNSQLFSKHAG